VEIVMKNNEERNYWVIFEIVEKKDDNCVGKMVCVVGDEEVAMQFCKDHKNFYYMSREVLL
jgi:hypothetical protein